MKIEELVTWTDTNLNRFKSNPNILLPAQDWKRSIEWVDLKSDSGILSVGAFCFTMILVLDAVDKLIKNKIYTSCDCRNINIIKKEYTDEVEVRLEFHKDKNDLTVNFDAYIYLGYFYTIKVDQLEKLVNNPLEVDYFHREINQDEFTDTYEEAGKISIKDFVIKMTEGAVKLKDFYREDALEPYIHLE